MSRLAIPSSSILPPLKNESYRPEAARATSLAHPTRNGGGEELPGEFPERPPFSLTLVLTLINVNPSRRAADVWPRSTPRGVGIRDQEADRPDDFGQDRPDAIADQGYRR